MITHLLPSRHTVLSRLHIIKQHSIPLPHLGVHTPKHVVNITNGHFSKTGKICATTIARRRSASAAAAAFSIGSKSLIAPGCGLSIPCDPCEFHDVLRDLPENTLTHLLRMPLQCFYALDE